MKLHNVLFCTLKKNNKVIVISFERATFSYSTVQPPFDINFSSSLVYIRKLVFGCPCGKCFTPALCVANLQHIRIYNLHRHTLSSYQFTPWSSGALAIHFLCPEKFTLGQGGVQISDLLICCQTHHHWTHVPHKTCCKKL